MNELQIFKNKEFGKLTVIEKDGESWFVAKEIAKILGYKLTGDMNRRLDNDEKANMRLMHVRSKQHRNHTVINESGLYNAILGSKKIEAKRFKKWVTSEVLPTIRKTGGYLNSEIDWTDLNNIQRVLDVAKEERQKRLKAEKTIKKQKPKVQYYDKVLDSSSCYTVTQIAKYLEMTAHQLNLILKQENIQYKQSGQWLLKKEYQNKGYTNYRIHTFKENGKNKTKRYTVWTEKGFEFIIDLMEKI